jgi:hypothetical protein
VPEPLLRRPARQTRSRRREYNKHNTWNGSDILVLTLSLLDKQRAAIKKAKNPGDVLLSRLAKGGPKPATKKTAAAAAVKAKVGKGKGVKAAAGKDKVARAKRDSGRMDVDKPAPAPAAAVAKPKTQAQLDEEMKAYERQRRFA